MLLRHRLVSVRPASTLCLARATLATTCGASHARVQQALPQPRCLSTSRAAHDVAAHDRIVKHPSTGGLSTAPPTTKREYVLTLSCEDKPGIVHAVTGAVRQFEANIIDSAQFGDPATNRFFMRVHFSTPPSAVTTLATDRDAGAELDAMKAQFASDIATPFNMTWELHDASVRPRVMLMVSKIGHCLNDLLYRWSTGQLAIDIPLIVSNHKDFYQLAASYNIPFHHLPLNKGKTNKEAQEERIW